MSEAPESEWLQIGADRLEVRRWAGRSAVLPTLLLLHEGLGSVGLWGGFPAALAQATGCHVVAYSRAGYGASSPRPLPWPLTYMHEEACDALPALLDAVGCARTVLIGHSDGASIAAIHAGSRCDPRVAGLVLVAPHFIVEDVTVAAIAEARAAYHTTDLRDRLARWHGDVDIAFGGWSGAWLDPAFRRWDITGFLPGVGVPVLILQGSDDQYGTRAQIEAAERHLSRPPQVVMLPRIRHAPHREAPAPTIAAIAAFLAGLPG
jgi:pimeloyl-ACP methyl ester carboxylesterase